VVEAVTALTHPREITVLGSSALLAHDPSLGDSGQPLELSLDADLLIEPSDEGQAAVVHEAVGEGSLFHREYGVYADLLRPEIGETLPPGWRDRCVPLEGIANARCLDAHDLGVAKLVLGRKKDIDLLRALLERGTIDLDTLRSRYRKTPLNEEQMFRAGRALSALAADRVP